MYKPKIYKMKTYKLTANRVPTSYWSIRAQNIFFSITQIPFLGLSAISTIVGVALLYSYFRSISQPLTDFTAVISLAVVGTIVAFGLLLFAAFALSLPLVALVPYETYEFEEQEIVGFTPFELYCASVFTASVFWLYFDFKNFHNFSVQPGVWSPLMLLLGCLSGALLIERALIPKTIKHFFSRLCTTVTYGVMSFIPLTTLYAFKVFFAVPFISTDIVLILIWLFVSIFTTNPKLAKQPTIAAVSFGSLSIIIFIWIPMATGQAARIPAMVATAIGIRSNFPLTLGVPKATCLQLQAAAIDDGLIPPNENCGQDSWNKVTARVLSNIGSNWLLEFSLTKRGDSADKKIYFRISVPASGIQQSRVMVGSTTDSTERVEGDSQTFIHNGTK